MKTDAALGAVLRQVPELGYEGFRAVGITHERHAVNRIRLSNAVAEFELAVAWLEFVPRIRTVGRTAQSSYFWKHVAERSAGRYISNGSFIAAALHLGFPVEPIVRSPNGLVGIAAAFERQFWQRPAA
jgi:hypothetical protein